MAMCKTAVYLWCVREFYCEGLVCINIYILN